MPEANSQKVVAVVQARMGSTRLPGKVLMDLRGEPMLTRVVERLARAATLSAVVIATTTGTDDDAIAALCARKGWSSFRGSEEDVLDRYYQAARRAGAQIVVRVTADCPLIEPAIVDRTVQEFIQRQPEIDYASNTDPRRTFPQGLDTEVFRFDVLEKVWREAREPSYREHVTLYIYRHPEIFHIHGVVNDTDYSDHRWTVDTLEDYHLVCRIYEHFGHDRFSWRDVLAVLEANPQWRELNRHIQQKQV
ncbi:MAG: glycosyltransferase family protein [Thermoguttaceae bacterium]|jgi:spore coat polysaccharide biosynthesis protein SpsF